MAKGRPTKPTALKELHGTSRPDRIKKDELQGEFITSHEPPEELNEWGVKLWNDLFKEYGKVNLITRLDIGSLLMMCNEFGTYCEADDLIKAQGLQVEVEVYNKNGEVVGTKTDVNPMLRVRDNAAKQYKMFCVEFGLTPVSRAKISAPKQESKGDELDELLNS